VISCIRVFLEGHGIETHFTKSERVSERERKKPGEQLYVCISLNWSFFLAALIHTRMDIGECKAKRVGLVANLHRSLAWPSSDGANSHFHLMFSEAIVISLTWTLFFVKKKSMNSNVLNFSGRKLFFIALFLGLPARRDCNSLPCDSLFSFSYHFEAQKQKIIEKN
jgi:hypothetical protein